MRISLSSSMTSNKRVTRACTASVERGVRRKQGAEKFVTRPMDPVELTNDGGHGL